MKIDLNIMVGGEAGQGVQSVGTILTKALARGGLHIFADQDYESRVRGGHNFFRVRVSNARVQALAEKLDILVAYNQETVELHRQELKTNGTIIVDGEQTGDGAGGDKYFRVPMVRLAQETARDKLMANTVAVGAVVGLIGYEFNLLSAVLQAEFARHGAKVVQDNIAAARAGFEFALKHGAGKSSHQVKPLPAKNRRLILNGNEALALGAIASGCKFIAGYPMTPASPILEFFAARGQDYNLVAVHVEDEIAAMNMAAGAAFTGVRAMVATSGGGFCLMVEGLALAGMTETPVVVILGQRPGPATGLPTRTEQGELWFALHAGHGEFPRAVLAPGTAEEAFYTGVKAFNLAEKYQTPVLILTDHHLATSYATVERFDLKRVNIDRGELLADEGLSKIHDYKRHLVTESGISPRALPGQGKALVVTDSDEHDEAGHMIEDAATRREQNLKRLRKRKGLSREISRPTAHRTPGAELTLIGWGSTCGAIREAAGLLKQNGTAVNTLHFSELYPFPAASAARILSKGGRCVVIENNATAQLAGLIRRETGYEVSNTILKFDGRPFSPEEIARRVRKEVL